MTIKRSAHAAAVGADEVRRDGLLFEKRVD